MLLKDDHEEKRRKSIKRERRKVREKGGKEAQMQMENPLRKTTRCVALIK